MGPDPMNLGGPVRGSCKRNPPTLVVLGANQLGQINGVGAFVPIGADDWCGQHTPGAQRAMPEAPRGESRPKLVK